MRTRDRLNAVDASARGWSEGLPGLDSEHIMLMRLIRVASQGIAAITDPVLRPSGLTESSWHTLVVVVASGQAGSTPSVLCHQVGQANANMTRILFVLETEKLIRIGSDKRDARRRRAIATPAGRKLVKTYSSQLGPYFKATFLTLSRDDCASLQRILREVILSMDSAETLIAGGG